MVLHETQRSIVQSFGGCPAAGFAPIGEISRPVFFRQFREFALDVHVFKGIAAEILGHHLRQFVAQRQPLRRSHAAGALPKQLKFSFNQFFEQRLIDDGERDIGAGYGFHSAFHRGDQARGGIIRQFERVEKVHDLLEFVAVSDGFRLLRFQQQRSAPVGPRTVGELPADRVPVFHARNQAAVGKGGGQGSADFRSVPADRPDRAFAQFRRAFPVQGDFRISDLLVRRSRRRGAGRISAVQKFVIIVHAVPVGIIRGKNRQLTEILFQPGEKFRMGALIPRLDRDRHAEAGKLAVRIERGDRVGVIAVRRSQPDIRRAVSGNGGNQRIPIENLEARSLKVRRVNPVPVQREYVDITLKPEVIGEIGIGHDDFSCRPVRRWSLHRIAVRVIDDLLIILLRESGKSHDQVAAARN